MPDAAVASSKRIVCVDGACASIADDRNSIAMSIGLTLSAPFVRRCGSNP